MKNQEMQELIKIEANENGIKTVNAKSLHIAVESKQRFSRWIETYLGYGFEDGVDYFSRAYMHTVANKLVTDYHVTIETAKHICMMQQNEAGTNIRKYFIECEKELQKIKLPQTYAEALLEAGKLALEIEKKDALLLEQKPKVEVAEAIEVSNCSVNIGKWVKSISSKDDVVIGQNKAFKWLRYNKYLMKNNCPYQKYIDNGYFEVLERVNNGYLSFTPKITGKGQIKLTSKIMNDFRGGL